MRRYGLRSRQRGFWNYLIPAAASIVGGLISKSGQEDANEANLQLGREQMAFQEKMSNSAYQRATADMRAAGVNPMLAVQQGGAGTPPGALPRVENTQAKLGEGLSNSAVQAGALMQAIASAKSSTANAALAEAQAEKVRSETYPAEVNAAFRVAELGTMQYEESKRTAEATTAWSEVTIRRVMAAVAAATQEAEVRKRKAESQSAEAEAKRSGGSWEADVRRRRAEAKLSELDIARGEAESQFWGKGGDVPLWIKPIMDVLRGVASITGARRGAFR